MKVIKIAGLHSLVPPVHIATERLQIFDFFVTVAANERVFELSSC